MAPKLPTSSLNARGSHASVAAQRKTERPESLHPERPINHHVTDHQVADPDKPGHPRSEPRPHQTQPLTPRPRHLTGGHSSDKQASRTCHWRFAGLAVAGVRTCFHLPAVLTDVDPEGKLIAVKRVQRIDRATAARSYCSRTPGYLRQRTGSARCRRSYRGEPMRLRTDPTCSIVSSSSSPGAIQRPSSRPQPSGSVPADTSSPAWTSSPAEA